MARLAVVHLVRRRNGLAPLQALLHSYRLHPAGMRHELVLLLKGFAEPLEPPVEALLAGLECRRLFVADTGRDIGAYRAAAQALTHAQVCFLNSFSVLQAGDWLAKLHAAAAEAGVGLVGASGSHQSLATNCVLQQGEPFRSPADPALWAYRALRYRLQLRSAFPPFPNAHVRTNGFLIDRQLFLRCDPGGLRGKLDSYRFESGRHSLTRQVAAAGLQVRVVGADGQSFAPDDWAGSRTFWSAEQENLMIADNQSRRYAQAGAAQRARLRRYAWGA